ncbi:hypothetical protein GW793_02990 [bacterium]|uniref:Uncharacterized protein n=2 Tax=Katanobacteria TaxID=422282 RepID=A0A2M7X2T0_UNCKA|nr:hypothetical protein [bacterium]PIP56446.1 MAG: hypothetical protein COX05_02980 [candidate division WWE3 bacterium CG22_combo_CG10-13_8_21_14_all_39_12]PJA40475.1 MAG: hypothetical protein CO179_02240 [candidate division WWE3 bacterium CG_4_9_14_3_um_filter_39_7]
MNNGIAVQDFKVGDSCLMLFKVEVKGAFIYVRAPGRIEEVFPSTVNLSSSISVRAVATPPEDSAFQRVPEGQEPEVDVYWVFHQTREAKVLLSMLESESHWASKLAEGLDAAGRLSQAWKETAFAFSQF